MKILLIEDEVVVAMALELTLTIGGHRVIAITADHDGAMTSLERSSPDLALVDIQLGDGRSGLDLAAELRSRGVPVIFATGNVPPVPRPDLALGCLPKPYCDEELVAALASVERYLAGESEALEPCRGFIVYRPEQPLAEDALAA